MKICPLCDGACKIGVEIGGRKRTVTCPDCDGIGKVADNLERDVADFTVTFSLLGGRWLYETISWRSEAFDKFPDAANRFTMDHVDPVTGKVTVGPYDAPKKTESTATKNHLSFEVAMSFMNVGWVARRPSWDKECWIRATGDVIVFVSGGKWVPAVHDFMIADWIVRSPQ